MATPTEVQQAILDRMLNELRDGSTDSGYVLSMAQAYALLYPTCCGHEEEFPEELSE